MDKKIAGLLGTMAALGTLNTVQASPAPTPSDALKVNSYADLLEPIPNAAKVLQALDEQAPAQQREADVKVAQYGYYHHHHHHHHHHHGFRYGPVVVVPPRGYYRHHHHHHHHHHGYYYDRY